MSEKWKWQSPDIEIESENVKLSDIKFGDINITGDYLKDATFKDLIPEIMNDMKHIISQSKIVPTPENWFTRKTGIAEGKDGSKRYGFRERCAIPVFRSPSMLESDSQKLGLGHTGGVDTDYTKLDRFEYLVKTNPSYVENLLTDILVDHLKKKGVTGITGIDSYLSSVKNVKFNTNINNDKINGVKWDEACKIQRRGSPLPSQQPVNQPVKQPLKQPTEAPNGQDDSKVNQLGGSIYKQYSKKIQSAGSLNQIKKIGGELKKLMTKGGGKHDKEFTKLIKQLGGKRDELAKNK